MNLLADCRDHANIARVMSSVHGPWAFAYWHQHSHTLLFGRDFFGRRSLCWHKPTDTAPYFALCSVVPPDCCDSTAWTEVPATGLYAITLRDGCSLADVFDSLSLYTWSRISAPYIPIGPLNATIPDGHTKQSDIDELTEGGRALMQALEESVRVRVAMMTYLQEGSIILPDVAILFSVRHLLSGLFIPCRAAWIRLFLPRLPPVCCHHIAALIC
jgi:hypothetical protein